MTVAEANPYSVAADIFDPPEWEPLDRPPLEPHQIAPEGFPTLERTLWLLEAGRGAGKTEACARYYTRYMRANPGHRGRVIAPTYDDAVESCVNGPSGVCTIDPEVRFVVQPGGSKLIWPGGSEARVLGTHTPRDVDRLRAAGNRHIDWWEEMAANAQLQAAWDMAAFGLRLGECPHSIASTTPRNLKAYKAIRSMDGTVLVNGISIDANPHLLEAVRAALKKRHKGTRLGRQELQGELLEDIEGALWTAQMLERARAIRFVPDLVRVVVAVDPAASHGPDSDDTGILVCGIGIDGRGYVLADRTCHLGPRQWGERAVYAYEEFKADMIVGEVNNGGEMVDHVIASVNPRVPFKAVHASRGKQTRAQPVASLYGGIDEATGEFTEGILKHADQFDELEDQLTTWVPGEEDSPDRLDALVWGFTELFIEEVESEEIVEDYQPVKIGVDV